MLVPFLTNTVSNLSADHTRHATVLRKISSQNRKNTIADSCKNWSIKTMKQVVSVTFNDNMLMQSLFHYTCKILNSFHHTWNSHKHDPCYLGKKVGWDCN